MFAEPQDTAADLHFSLAGIRVRVSAWFWLAAALIGWNVCQSFSRGDQRALLQFLALWVGAVFVSLLVHEFGHALAYRFFGQSAHVVLYHFGGLAVPETWGRRGYLRPFQRLVVSAAGPLAQLAFAALIVAGLKGMGHMVPFPLEAVGARLGLYEGRELGVLPIGRDRDPYAAIPSLCPGRARTAFSRCALETACPAPRRAKG
jgi:hypothetical protein